MAKKRIHTFEDVAGSDDEFHLNQDEIRLGEEPAAKRRRKLAEDEEFLQPSDEEVLGHSEAEESSDEESGNNRDVEEEEEDDAGVAGWGTSKDALYGHDAIETEEQALEEEQEGIRLQKRQLQQMRAADYGFDEDEWQTADQDGAAAADHEQNVVSEFVPRFQIAPDMGAGERLKLLKSRYPEFEPLSKQLLRLREEHTRLSKAAGASSLAQIKLKAASAYLGALVMYFSLLTSPAAQAGHEDVVALPATQLRDHPLMISLVKCRELWERTSTLPEHVVKDSSMSDQGKSLELAHETVEEEQVSEIKPATSAKNSSRADRHAAAIQEAREQRRAEKLQRAEADLANLDSLILAKSKAGTKTAGHRHNSEDDQDLGEEAPLTAREAADKAQKKKSLRFYTSQIAQKANKRGNAGRTAGGDDDIPYRERLRDRQARLNAEAEKRGKRGGDGPDADLGGDSDEDDHQRARDIRAAANDDDEYYDLVATKTAKKKSDKAAFAEVQRQAALQGGAVVQQEVIGPDGKRKISYAIEKNKGLTPHRKKDVRNPRVKKRKKYDEKKKKLASIKPVYKGGEGRGGYAGELTGIKGSLVKSTKLS
ncbi:hypothetical protein CERZMDRAFT_101062 [Cercospora zeae-maydis SCOH1-5]|uniref:Sas10 C-terminal domain-containing protein n=1 Tax=Cercospora zeae-maydis SCOH1-5 TaxID=717836 RepID=A0A6A6F7W9_9PEZI|nr:hypothetical protein CERZMDRAFT_101062 [Cercospora zeae-maydis SCOH1-5]